MSEFIFVRHGQSRANLDKIIADRNSPLTALGYEQAKQTGINLKGFGITAIAVLTFFEPAKLQKQSQTN